MARLLQRGLRDDGFVTDVCGSGEDALWMAGSTPYDAIVLDVMLPGIDGFETCRRLRADGVWAPILMLTARDSVEDRVAGLDGGADDYLAKPFSFAELDGADPGAGPARVGCPADRARASATSSSTRPAAASPGPAPRSRLSAKEFALLETFMRSPGAVLEPPRSSSSTPGTTSTRTART